VAGVLVLLAACARTSDEAKIRNAIDAMVQALEARDNRAFLAHVAESYRDHEGRDVHGLRQLLLANFLQHRNITVFVSGTTVERHGARAEVRFDARLTSGEQLLVSRFGAYRVRTLWQRTGGDWQIYQAGWEPLPATS
jgi:hypothetical protein